MPKMGWSLRRSRSTLGHYDPAHDAVVISNLLDSAESSYLIVSYVLFHELLHTVFPAESRTARRCVHTAEFKAAEKSFKDYGAATTPSRSFWRALRAVKQFGGRRPGGIRHSSLPAGRASRSQRSS